ncbi:MAG TPA: calcium-binding protein, partial [Acidimicrobiia bacterium]
RHRERGRVEALRRFDGDRRFVDYEFSPAGVVVNLSTRRATGEGTDRLASIEEVVGSPFDDTLTGDASRNALIPLGGNNTVDGGSGEDMVDYEASPVGVVVDLTAGTATGPGTDTLANIEDVIGSMGNDTITGNAADNFLIGYMGSDTISGGDGDDELWGLDGDDTLSGGNGFDWILTLGSGNTIDGGPDEDMVDFEGSPAGVIVNLTTGTATGGGTATLANIEDVVGSSFDDTLTGNDLMNWIIPFGGNDTVDGGAGEDMVDFEVSASGVVVDLTTGTATGEGTDALTNIEDVFGSSGNDTITGNETGNWLVGWTGDDTISGGDGDDALWGLDGDDTLDGGNGTDSLDGGRGTDTCVNGEANVNCESAPSPVPSRERSGRTLLCLSAPGDRAGAWSVMARHFRHAPTGSVLTSFTRVGAWALVMERFHCGAAR